MQAATDAGFTGITRAEVHGDGSRMILSTQTYIRGSTMTKDPVCGMKVDENNAAAQSQYHGQKYSFCSDECRQKFEQNPEQYTQATAA